MMISETISVLDRTAVCVCSQHEDGAGWELYLVVISYRVVPGTTWHPKQPFATSAEAIEAGKVWLGELL